MSHNQEQAVRLLARKRGATVEELAERLELPGVPAARGLITRVKRAGRRVENIGPHRFKLAA